MSNIELDNIEVTPGAQATLDTNRWAAPARVSEADVRDAATMLGGAFTGNRRRLLDLHEAITTSDLFRSATGVVLDREAMAAYEDITPVWQGMVARTTVRDFRPKQFTDLFGGRQILDPVPEGTEYPARNLDASEYQISVAKRGGRFQITFEDIINDDLDQLRDLPGNLAQGARDTEDYLAASLLVNTTGVNTDFFKAGNGNAPTAVPLTLENVDAALQSLAQRKAKDGRPTVAPSYVLVVPQGLQSQALRVLNATEVRRTEANGDVLVTTNTLSGNVRVVVNPWLTFINQGSKAGTTWFLVPDPGSRRKAFALAFLRGHEAPDLRYKNDQGNSVGGGQVAADEGSFDDDTIQYRVRHILGAATLDPTHTYASTGS